MQTNNPYAAQGFDDLPSSTTGDARPRLSLSILRQIRVIAILLLIHGIMLVLTGILLLGVAIIMPSVILEQQKNMQQQPNGPTPEQLKMIMLAMYSGMAVAGLIPGVLQIVAGSFNLALKKRMLGIVALIVGALSVGTCYCTPTAIGLLIYGLIIYLHDTSKQAFALREQGKSWEDIESLAR